MINVESTQPSEPIGEQLRDTLLSVLGQISEIGDKLKLQINKKAALVGLASLILLSACAPDGLTYENNSSASMDFAPHEAALLATVESPLHESELRNFIEQHPQIAEATYLLSIPTANGVGTCTGTMVEFNGKSFIVTADHCINSNIPYIELTQPHLPIPPEPIYTTLEGSEIFNNKHADTIAIEVPTKPVDSGLVQIGIYNPNLPVFSLAFPSVPNGLVTTIINGMPSNMAEINEAGHQAILIYAPTTPGGSGAGVFQLDQDGNPYLVATTRGIDPTQLELTTAAYLVYDTLH